jgi:hypothetical protein
MTQTESVQILATLETLLPQYRERCAKFYETHDAGSDPLVANRWIHRELMERFGVQPVLTESAKIRRRLTIARTGVQILLKGRATQSRKSKLWK